MNKQKKSESSRGIEWTDYTWNPVAGCFHACQWTMPDGLIANCYAEDVATRVAGKAYPHGFEHHYWYPKRLTEPARVKDAARIFVGSMADVFGHWVNGGHIESILDVCEQCSQHTFQFLTKNAVRTADFDLSANCWLGTSTPPTFMWNKALTADQQQRMMARSLASLAQSNADIRWISAEPLTFDLAPILRGFEGLVDWIVIGAASNGKQLYPPDQSLVERLLDECAVQGIAVFFKGNMRVLPFAAANWREEFPTQQEV